MFGELELLDLADPAVRERVSAASKAIFENIGAAWTLTDEQRSALVPGYKDSPLSEQSLVRIGHLLGIAAALSIIFGDELGDRWMSLPNANPLFGGTKPIDWLIEHGEPAFTQLRQKVDAASVGNF